MNMSPSGPLLHVTCGKLAFVTDESFESAWFGVSSTLSERVQPPPSSPQMCRRFNQCPTSCVAVRPMLKGGAAVPVEPNAVNPITTPSVSAAPPGNWAYPRSPPVNRHTQRFRYESRGHAG